MSFSKNLSKLAGSLLIGGIAIASIEGLSLEAAAGGNLRIGKPLKLVAENDREVLLVSTPSLKQVRDFIQKVLPTNPGRYGYRRVFSPEVIRIDRAGKQTRLLVRRHQVNYSNPVTSEPQTIDLLSFDSGNNRRWIAEPWTRTQPLFPNPKNPHQLFFQNSNSEVLYLLDTKTLKVQPINSQGLRAAIAKIRNLPPTNTEYKALLYWVSDPTWSPNGRQIAFSSNRDNFSDTAVWLHDIAKGKDIRVLARSGVTFRVHGWTADNRILATEIDRNSNNYTLLAINPATAQSQQLAAGDFRALSDDGKTLIYETRPNKPYLAEVYALSLTTGKTQLLFKDNEAERFTGGGVDFSADSQRIVMLLGDTKSFRQTLLVYERQHGRAKRLPLPSESQLERSFGERLEWAGSRLLVPLANHRKLISETLLMSLP